MTETRSRYRLGIALVFAAAVAWSLSGLFTRAIITDTPTILFWRGLFGAIGMFLLIALVPGAGKTIDFRSLGLRGWGYALVTSISMLLFIGALRQTSVAHVAVITASVPFLAGLLGWMAFRELPNITAVLASFGAFIGIVVMVGFGEEGSLFGDGMALLMALCMAAMIIIARRFGNTPALATTCLASLITAVATLPLATIFEITLSEVWVLALFGLVNQVLGFGLFALGARYLPPMQTALITALDAPLAPMWVWLIFSEIPTGNTILGGAIVLAAVVSHIILPQHKIKRPPETPTIPKTTV